MHVARRGYDGDIVGYREAIVHDPNMSSTNSTSLSRPFGSMKTFVRGNASQFPFAPGGLEDEVVDVDDIDAKDVGVDLDFLHEGQIIYAPDYIFLSTITWQHCL